MLINSQDLHTVDGMKELLKRGSNLLKIDKNNLDKNIIEQPVLYEQVGRAAAIAKSIHDRYQDELKQVDSELYLSIREELENSNKRATESMVQAMVINSEEHRNAYQKLLEIRRISDELNILKESFIQRSYMIKELVQLFVSDYFTTTHVKAVGTMHDNMSYESNLETIKEYRKARNRKRLEEVLEKDQV